MIERQPPTPPTAHENQPPQQIGQALWLAHGRAWISQAVRYPINRSASASAAKRNPITTMVTARQSIDEKRMARTVRLRPVRITYQSGASVGLREDEVLGLAWGCKASSAHQRKLRVAHEAADVIRTKRQAGAIESLAGWLRPIEEALAHQSPAAGNPELSASLADCAEDSAEACYRAEPTEANARLLLRKRAMERQTSLDHDRAIAARFGITL